MTNNLPPEKLRSCQVCERMFAPRHGAVCCCDACRFQLHLKVRHCAECGDGFISEPGQDYCSDDCRSRRIRRKLRGIERPVVYCFCCPSGQRYVGSVRHSQDRGSRLGRSNSRIDAALKTYPFETWACKVLEQLEPGCSELKLRTAEQWHINRLKTWMPEYGFNIVPAVIEMATPEQRAQLSIDRQRAQRAAMARAPRKLLNCSGRDTARKSALPPSSNSSPNSSASGRNVGPHEIGKGIKISTPSTQQLIDELCRELRRVPKQTVGQARDLFAVIMRAGGGRTIQTNGGTEK